MKTILALLLFASTHAAALVCHSTPTADDVAFYDRAVVSTAKNMTWDGYNGNIFAHEMIDRRRIAFATLDGIPASGPLTDDEGALYDSLLASALEHAAINMAGGMTWLNGTLSAEWAHGIAWQAMYYRMHGRC